MDDPQRKRLAAATSSAVGASVSALVVPVITMLVNASSAHAAVRRLPIRCPTVVLPTVWCTQIGRAHV